MADNVIELVHLQKQFGDHAVLRDINLSVKKGEVLSIIGASGSGKSTMLRCINLLETPSSGQVLYHGQDITAKDFNLTQYRTKVGMVFQSFNLFNNMSALNNCIAGQVSALKRSRKEAEEYINAYFARYPKIKTFMEDTIKNGTKNGYVSTLWNRRRNMPELQSSNFMQRAAGERAAMNMPIQGTAADIIKLAMIKVHRALQEGGYRSRLILQVHDELLIEAYKEEKEAVAKILKENMEHAADLLVPLDVDVHEGASWFEAK